MPITPVGDLLIAIKADVDDFHKGMATARESMAVLKTTAASVGRTMRRVGAIMTGMGAIAAGSIAVLVNETNRLDRGFREINTLLEKGEKAQTQFADAARRISEEFAVQGGQLNVIRGLYQSISAGITDAAGATTVMENSARLATVAMADMETSIDVLTTALNAYSLEASESERISNLLFGTVQKGKVRLDELARALGPLIAFSSQLNVSFEEVSASMALLTKQGISARRAARSLRSTMRKFMNPSQAMVQVLKEMAGEEIKLSNEARNAMEAFRSQQQELTNLQETHTQVTQKIRGLNDTIASNEAKIRSLRSITAEERQEIVSLRFDIEEATRALRGMGEEMDSLTDSMRENRIKIKEIRLQARKEGRQLTEEEKSQIEELRLANEELSLEQLKLEDRMDEVRDTRRQSKNEIAEKTQLTEKEFKQVQRLKQENKKLSSQVETLRDTQSELSRQINEQKAEVKKAEDTWDAYASQLGTTLLEQQGFGESLRLVREHADELNLPLSKVINNQRALMAVYPILNNDMKEYNSLLQFMKEGGADVADIYENRVRPTLDRKFRTAINKLRNTMAELGKQLKQEIIPIIEDVNSAIERFRNWWVSLDEVTKEAAAKFGVLAAALGLIVGPILIVTGTLVTMIALLGPTGVAWALGLATVATAGLVGAFVDLKKGGENVQGAVENVRDILSSLAKVARRAWNIFSKNLLPSLIELGSAFGDVAEELSKMLGKRAEVGLFANAVERVAKVLGNAISSVAEFISANDKAIAKVISFTAKIAGLVTGISLIIGIAGKVRTAIFGLIGTIGTFGAKATGIVRVVQGAFGTLAGVLRGGIGIRALVSSVLRGSKAFTVLRVGISAVASVLGVGLAPAIAVVTGIIGAATAAVLAYKENWAGFADLINGVATTLRNYVVGVFNFVFNEIIFPLLRELSALWDQHVGTLAKEAEQTVSAFQGAISRLEPVFAFIIDIIMKFGDVMMSVWKMIRGPVLNIAKFFADQLVMTLTNLADIILTTIEIILDLFQFDFSGAANKFVALFGRIIGRVTGLFLDWNIATTVTNVISAIPDAAAKGIGLFVKIFSTGFNKVKEVASNKINGMVNTVVKLISRLVNTIQRKFTQWIAKFKNTITSWAQWVANRFRNLKKKVSTIISNLTSDIIRIIKSWIRNFLRILRGWTSDVLSAVAQFGKNIYSDIKGIFGDIWDFFTTWVGDFVTKVDNWLGDVLSKVTQWGINLIFGGDSEIKKIFRKIWNWLFEGGWAGRFLTRITTWLSNVLQAFIDWGKDLIFGSEIKKIFNAIYNWIFNGGWAADFLGKIKQWLTDIKNAFKNKLNAAKEQLENKIGAAKDFFADKMDSMKSKAKNILGDIKDEFQDKLGTVKSIAEDLVDEAKNAYQDAKDWLSKNLPTPDVSSGTGDDGGDDGGGSPTSQPGPSSGGVTVDPGDFGSTIGVGTPGIGLQHGGLVTGDAVPAMLHGPEAVMPLPDLQDLIRTVGGFAILNDMQARMSGTETKSTTLVVEEGAMKIERGAFEGVAEEELPEKVGDEVDDRIQQIMDQLRGTGR